MFARLLTTSLVLSAAIGVPSATAQTSGCRAANSNTSDRLAFFKVLFVSTDSLNSGLRAQFRVPATTAANMKLVTTTATCQRAVRALDSLARADGLTPPASRQVYVYKIGSFWAAEDPTTPDMTEQNGQRLIMFFSNPWGYLSSTMRDPK